MSVKAIARQLMRWLGNWDRGVPFFTTEEEVPKKEGQFLAVVFQPGLACSRRQALL